MRKIEILAPAGSYDSLKAAVTASCDAVYIGGSLFGARAYANNLDEDKMNEAIEYAHIHNKALYLTVNTLLKEDELNSKLYDYIVKYYEIGLDAAIVQDLGVLHFLHRNFPDLPLHASTQMTLTMAEGANLLKNYGVTRLVTSRELSLQEIKNIRDNTDLEIESFVHGALCYCYSGQCLMSSMIGGRSGNRGRCAQPCRMPYNLYYDGKKLSKGTDNYLLSPKDICTLSIIPELVDAGIDSFKIEGRMKRPEYTALAAHLYRKYVNLYQRLGRKDYTAYMEKHYDELERDEKDLMDLYNRGNFTKGYYVAHNGKDMMSLKRPNHNGVLVGTVVKVSGNNATIELIDDVHAQDLLEIRKSSTNNKAMNSYEYTLKDGAKKGATIRTNFYAKTPIYVGQEVYRLKNQELLNRIDNEYLATERREGIEGYFVASLDQPMELTLMYHDVNGEHTITVYGESVTAAKKQGATEDQVRKQINKMNTTAFNLTALTVCLDDMVFLPNGQLNELRRRAVAMLQEDILKSYHRTLKAKKQDCDNSCAKAGRADDIDYNETNKDIRVDGRGIPGICVHLEDTKLLDTVLEYKEIEAVYLNCDELSTTSLVEAGKKVKEAGSLFYIVLPAILRADTSIILDKTLSPDILGTIDGIVIKNLEEFSVIQDKIKKYNLDLLLDSNLYTLNQEAKCFWREQGVSHFTTSLELNYKELKKLDLTDSDMVIYGHNTLMVSAQCLRKSTVGCVKDKSSDYFIEGENSYYQMKDMKQNVFYVKKHCRYCYNTIYNGKALYLINQLDEIKKLKPRRIRLEFTIEEKDEVRRVIEDCIKNNGQGILEETNHYSTDRYTKGHYNRGIE